MTRNLECTGLFSFTQFVASALCNRNPLRTCRYVSILTRKSALQLCEVEIYSRGNSTNVKLEIKRSSQLWVEGDRGARTQCNGGGNIMGGGS